MPACGLQGQLYAYLNYNGPTGTARDELAEGMLALAIEARALTPGQPIIEAAVRALCHSADAGGADGGHPVTLVMPEDAPALRQESLLRLGAQIIHSPAQAGLQGACTGGADRRRERLVLYELAATTMTTPPITAGSPALHSCAPSRGRYQHLWTHRTIGVGSAGTVTGVGETVKAWTNDVRIVAVEPYESQALGGGLTGSHGIPDIGFGLVPGNYNSYVVDNVRCRHHRRRPACGPAGPAHRCHPASASAGAALHAAAQLIANGKSRSALAVFSARQNIL